MARAIVAYKKACVKRVPAKERRAMDKVNAAQRALRDVRAGKKGKVVKGVVIRGGEVFHATVTSKPDEININLKRAKILNLRL